MAASTVLVTGARGKTGRLVAAALAGRPGIAVRGGSATPERVGADGVVPVAFDWQEPATWAPALDGVDAVYLMRPELQDAAQRVADLAAAAPDGARIVLLSETGGEHLPRGSWVADVEHAVIDSGRPWTILRPNWFQQVLTDDRFYRADIAERGVLSLPTGGAPIAWIDTADIAAVAVEALTQPGHEGAAYTLSGPAALTLDEVAQLVGAARGRPVRALDPPPEEVLDGLDPWLVRVLDDLYERVRTGGFGEVTDDVLRVTGRPPGGMEAFVAANASAWR